MLQRSVLQNTFKGTWRKLTSPATQEPSATPLQQINNRLWSQHKIWLTTAPTLVNTPIPAYHHQSPCPLTTSLPPLTPHAIYHHSSDYRSTVPQSPHFMQSLMQPAHPQLLLNLFNPPQTSTVAPQTHYPTFPCTVIPPQPHTPHLNNRMGTSERHKGAELRMTIIFFLWDRCTMYNSNWTTWWQWWVQLQLPETNQFILNNQLQHPRNVGLKIFWGVELTFAWVLLGYWVI